MIYDGPRISGLQAAPPGESVKQLKQSLKAVGREFDRLALQLLVWG